MPASPQILPPSPSASNAHRFDTYAALAAGGVVFALAVLLIWLMYKLSVSGVGPQDMTTHVPSYAGAAVDVAALPVFVVHADEVAGDDATAVECAVCLAEVRDGERGRLLPRCGHRFHVECIDRWFGTNSTCPVCRAVAVGQLDDVEACKGGGPAPVGVVEQS